MDPIEDVIRSIIGAAIEVHRYFGPGLLESAYEAALCSELEQRGLPFQRQVPIAAHYKGADCGLALRADLIVSDAVVVELKSARSISVLHVAQARTYLRLTGLPWALLFNFNTAVLRDGGIRRLAPNVPERPTL